jgi:YfiR/HmsC-like
MSLAGSIASAMAEAPESAIKAAYLTKFAPFVVWPATAYPSAKAPLVICVQCADPFGGELDRLSAGKSMGPHPIIVRRIETLAPDSGCHIAYVAGSPAQPAAAALKAVAQAPVLTVTDEESPGGGKGIVRLFLSNGRVRFAIDPGMASRAGLTISSKLRALAMEPGR